MAEELSFEDEIKQSKVKFKAIQTCFLDTLDALLTRQVEKKISLDSTLIVDVSIQLVAACFRESFKPYEEPKAKTSEIEMDFTQEEPDDEGEEA